MIFIDRFRGVQKHSAGARVFLSLLVVMPRDIDDFDVRRLLADSFQGETALGFADLFVIEYEHNRIVLAYQLDSVGWQANHQQARRSYALHCRR